MFSVYIISEEYKSHNGTFIAIIAQKWRFYDP
jgi:hypothetical protein